LQRLLQVVQLIHHVQPREVGHAVGTQARLVKKPFAQGPMSRSRGLVNPAAGPALRFRAAAAKQAFAFELLQGGIDLAEFGRPEIVDALVEQSLEVVAAGGFAE
jgi:hypothetical protein